MSKILSLLSPDHLKRAEGYLKAGDKGLAAGEYSKAGDHNKAARLAAEVGDEPSLVKYTLLAALGELPVGYRSLGAREAGELLAARGHHRKAISLFERVGDFRRAAVALLRLGQVARAAQMFEKAKARAEAALYYEQADLPGEALRVLQQEAASLAQQSLSRVRPEGFVRLEDVNLKRVDLLLRLEKTGAALALLREIPPSTERARLLEKAGSHAEALNEYLDLGCTDEAARLTRSSPESERLKALGLLRAGRPQDAGDLFARAGFHREAAEAYEAAEKWAMAAYRWEAAEELVRGAESYRRAGRPRDAARCYLAAGRQDLALQAYTESGDHAAVADLLVRDGRPLEAATYLLTAKRVERAAFILSQLRPDHPGLAEATVALVPFLLERGGASDALTQLQRLPQILSLPGKRDAVALDRLYWEGRTLEALGQQQGAREAYRQVVSLDPGHRDVVERLGGRAAGISGVAVSSLVLSGAAAEGEGEAGSLRPGSRLAGRYDILAELGRGGMGLVYKARDLELDELVAIKVMVASSTVPLQQERLMREVQICRRISHPNVVRIYDLGRFAGGVFVTMELLEGSTLESVILLREAPLGFARIRGILQEVAQGLLQAHALGIVHRDLKPANLFVTDRGLKILDFGIARMDGFDAQFTQTGLVFGSPAFMSPEQLLAQPLDGRSDLYSLGVVAFMMIAGNVPFRNDNPNALALAHLHEQPPSLQRLRPETPAAWTAFVSRLLAKRACDRYASAAEVLAALAQLPDDATHETAQVE